MYYTVKLYFLSQSIIYSWPQFAQILDVFWLDYCEAFTNVNTALISLWHTLEGIGSDHCDAL